MKLSGINSELRSSNSMPLLTLHLKKFLHGIYLMPGSKSKNLKTTTEIHKIILLNLFNAGKPNL